MFEHRPLRGLAHQAAEQKQEPEFGNEDRFRIGRSCSLGCDRRGRQDENDRGKQKTGGTQQSRLRRIIRPDRPVACCHSTTTDFALGNQRATADYGPDPYHAARTLNYLNF